MTFSFSGGTWLNGNVRASRRYLVALALFILALSARFMLIGILPARGFPFLSFFPAVLLTTYLVGLGPGLLVALLSTAAAWAFFMGDQFASLALGRSDIIALLFFAVILFVDCIVIERMNGALRQVRMTSAQLRHSEQALLERQRELEDANRQKDVFIAMLAHELRNPLAPILSSAQLISLQAKNNEKLAKSAAIIVRQSLQLTRLVDDLLDVSRIHSSKLAMQLETLDIRTVIASALETMQPVIDKSRVDFMIELPAEPLLVCADATRMAQCIANLLDNAFKFTPDSGQISLHVAPADSNTLTITVTDNGRGISKDMLPRVFQMFEQEGSSGRNGDSGLGIGLALCQYLVGRHQGTLTAHSEGTGTGARFAITLPVLATCGGAPLPSTPAVNTVAANRILIVEDNEDGLEAMQELLLWNGFIVDTAVTGAEALLAMAAYRYDAILLDIGLPDMSGYDVALAGKSRSLLPESTLVVALTGWSDVASQRQSEAAGIDHHLNKPVKFNVLLDLLTLPELPEHDTPARRQDDRYYHPDDMHHSSARSRKIRPAATMST
jgi:signal transduction histidine kinase/FixJ family two-component response regulator